MFDANALKNTIDVISSMTQSATDRLSASQASAKTVAQTAEQAQAKTEEQDGDTVLLYHYTRAENVASIIATGLRPSIRIPDQPSSDAQHGDGHYLTDLSPSEAARFTRPQVSQAFFMTPRKWGTVGNLAPIAWVAFAFPKGTVQRVAPLFPSQVTFNYPSRGIWLYPSTGILSSTLIRGSGLVTFQPMANGNQ